MTYFLVYIVAAYLIGSIPTAIWYGRIFHKTDIRQHGSGNAGATNTIRTFGRTAGIIVLLIDITKGYVAVFLPSTIGEICFDLSRPYLSALPMYYYPLILGLTATLGHIYPIYEKFRGGKGVATLLGVVLCLDPLLTLYALGTFILLFILTKRVSVGSIFSGIAFTVAFIIYNHSNMMLADYICISLYPTLIMYTHRSNIKRLMKGTEPKLSLGKKKD